MTDWITNWLPTEADADLTGDVIVCTSPTLHKELKAYISWRGVTPGWPWRHTEYWTPPTPEPSPAAPEQGSEGWITNRTPTKEDGDSLGHVNVNPGIKDGIYTPTKVAHYTNVEIGIPWRRTAFWRSKLQPEPSPAAPEPEPEPEKATRGFARITTILANEKMQLQIAIATDGTAWRRFVVCGDWDKWEQIQPLPQPGEE